MEEDYLLPQLMVRSAPEDILTESLAHLLRNSLALRRQAAPVLWEGGQATDEDEIETQRESGGGRADLVWSAPDRRLIWESKIDALLGQDQPNRYVLDLMKGPGHRSFALVAPHPRLVSLRHLASSHLQQDYSDCSWTSAVGRVGTVRLVCVSWRDVGSWIRRAMEDEKDLRIQMHMEEVGAVIDAIDPRFESNPDKLAVDGLGGALRDLCRLVASIHSHLGAEGAKVSKIRSGEMDGWYYGFSIHDGLCPARIWFGVWIGPWAAEKLGPLWIDATEPEAVKWLRGAHRHAVKYGAHYVLPLRMEGATWDEVRDKTLLKLKELLIKPKP